MATDVQTVLGQVAELAAGVEFVESADAGPDVCDVRPIDNEHECWYRIEIDEGRYWVAWMTPDRYLSQSIEAELVYTGDDLDDMIDEELTDQPGWTLDSRLDAMEHFRTAEKLFTFRSRTPIEVGHEPGDAAACLVAAMSAYHEALTQLGDLKEDEDD